jgi:hypothetical protein
MHRYLITLFFISSSLFADISTQTSIDAQISAIKNAAPSERVKLMNAFKVRVSQMNHQEQANAITAMHSQMINKEHSSQMQMQESTHISHTQNSNQHQLGDQVSHKIINDRSEHETPIQKHSHQ